MKRLINSKEWLRVPDMSARPRKAPPTYEPNLSFTMSVPEYAEVNGRYYPMTYVATERPVEEEFLSVGELREFLASLPASLPDSAEVSFFDSEYSEYVTAKKLSVDGEGLHIE